MVFRLQRGRWILEWIDRFLLRTWVLDEQEDHDCEQDAGRTDDEEHRAPADDIDEKATEHHTEQRTYRYTEIVDGKRLGALLRPGHISDQRHGRRRTAGLTKTNTEAGQRELPEVLRKANDGRTGTPDNERNTDQSTTVCPFCDARNRNTKRRIQKGEGKTRDSTKLPVGELKIMLDVFSDNVDDLTVEIAERIGCAHGQDEANRKGSAAFRFCRTILFDILISH